MSTGLVEQKIGGPPLVFGINHNGVLLELTGGDIVAPVITVYGRRQPDTRPDPSQLSITVLRSAFPTWLPELGDLCYTKLSTAVMGYLGYPSYYDGISRFGNGKVTDVQVIAATYNDDGSLRTPAQLAIVAVGERRTEMAEHSWDPTYTDDVPPYDPGPSDEMYDGQMVAAFIDAASNGLGASYAVLATGGAMPVLRNTDTLNVLASIDNLSEVTGGEMTEGPTAGAWWRSSTYPDTLAATITLDASSVINSPQRWTKSRAGLVNKVTAPYGRAGDPTYPEGSVVVTDQLAADRHGTGTITLPSGYLVNAAWAQKRAEDIVSRRGRPTWSIDALEVDLVRTVTPAQAEALFRANMWSRGTLTGFPAEGPYATLAFTVEGYTETLGRDEWRMSLSVSDRNATGPGPSYASVPPAVTYASVDHTLSYLGARAYSFA